MPSHAALPDDIDALKAMIRERDDMVEALREELSGRKVEIEQLKLFIAKLKRMQFGRKSEKLDRQIEQLELKLEDLQADEEEAAVEMERRGRAIRTRSERKPLPPHLPREEKVYRPDAVACPDCGGELRQLGEDVSEQLEFIPASFKVIRHIRPKLACACCDSIVQAPAPSRPIERGMAGPGLLAHVLVSKPVAIGRLGRCLQQSAASSGQCGTPPRHGRS
jgi:transposase